VTVSVLRDMDVFCVYLVSYKCARFHGNIVKSQKIKIVETCKEKNVFFAVINDVQPL